MTVAYSGDGQLGEEPLRVYGQAEWIYNADEDDYLEMNFNNVVRFGEGTVWHWVLGGEILVGGALGVATGVVSGPLAGVGAAIASGSALVGASAAAKTLIPDEPASKPATPERPPVPSQDQEVVPSEGVILTAIATDGTLYAAGPDGKSILSGSFDVEQRLANGDVSG